MSATGKELNLAEGVLKLQDLLDADLLPKRDTIEEVGVFWPLCHQMLVNPTLPYIHSACFPLS